MEWGLITLLQFFSSTLPSKLPPTLLTLAQTIAQQPSWWHKFSGTDTVKPKALSFSSKSNVYANKLPQWGTSLSPFEWRALTGMDRASIGILLSVAVLQIYDSCELDERTVLEQCAGLLLHIQFLARSCTTHEVEGDGGPVLSPITVPDPAANTWPGNPTWATTQAGVTAVPLESPTEDELPSITSSVDHDSAELLFAEYNKGTVKVLSPQKRRAGLAVVLHQASPSDSLGRSSPLSPTARLPNAPGKDGPSATLMVPGESAVPPGSPLSHSPPPSARSPPRQPVPPSSPLSEPPDEDEDDRREFAVSFCF